ncbi:MAG: OpgC domain-containing protein [Chloroflexota bacterium]
MIPPLFETKFAGPRSWLSTDGKRDLRIDLLRGYAMLAIIVDHVGGDQSWLYSITGGNEFLASAAEGFIFMSGLVTGIVYAGAAARGLGDALLKVLKRARRLYVFTVGLTLGLPLLAGLLNLDWDIPYNDVPLVDWLVSVLTLHRTYFLADVIMVYALLFPGAALALLLIVQGQTRIVLAGSWALWLLWQIWPQYATVPWDIADNAVFNLAPWQVVFFTALVIGVHRRAVLDKLRRVSPALGVAISLPLLILSVVFFHFRYQVIGALLPDHNADAVLEFVFGKSDLRAGRLLEFAIIAFFAFSAVTLLWKPLHRAVCWLLLPLGQNSLAAYTIHMVVVAVAAKITEMLFGLAGPTRLETTLTQVCAVALVWLGVRIMPAITSLANLLDVAELGMLGEAKDAVLARIPSVLILPLRRPGSA